MSRTIYRIYKNGEFMEGQTWAMKETAIDIMIIEIGIEMEELQAARPDSQFSMDVDRNTGVGSIDEYYYDENYEEDCWNFDISKYEVKEFIR